MPYPVAVVRGHWAHPSGADTTPPSFSTGEIGDVDVFTVAVVFNETISTTSDYVTGVTIKVDSVAAAITAGTLQGDSRTVYYTIPRVAQGSGITWEYSDAAGGIEDSAGNQLGDVAATNATNDVGRHLWFNDLSDSGHVVHLYA